MKAGPTIGSLLRRGESALKGGDSPRLDAELLLAGARRCSRAALFSDRDEAPAPEVADLFLRWIAERARGLPVAYLLGRREFWSLRLEVTPATLIPRPETELLVERALELVPEGVSFRVADLGTGSGAIALAIASERPSATVVATDRCEAALAVASRNAARLGIRNVTFRTGSWFGPLAGETFDLIVSNPPYVEPGDPHLREGDLRFEPISALVGGPEGLEAIREIARDTYRHLSPGGFLALEHGVEQASAVRQLMIVTGYRAILTYRDLAGGERVTLGQRPRGDV
ncbi:MAG: peptide chain release factor N(5)-glutamine methyltransferase [Gammaproteobacteria bacterium]|nr:peptide chain release factor N(5)-glutamine methyltransferase [Gammaproteobacteria bacterium]